MSRSMLLALTVWSLAGCASHVQWLPNSRSFLYSHQDGRVLRYDLESHESTTITQIEQGDEKSWPLYSLRVDGEQIVMAESTAAGNETRLVTTTLKFLSLDGGQVREESLSWPALDDAASEPKRVPTYVEWSPDARHVLLGTNDAVALYNVAEGTFRVHEDLEQILPGFLGASPWRPDADGFLASRPREDADDQPVFVTVAGEVRPLELEQSPEGKISWPIGHWDGPVLKIQTDSSELQIDTARLRVTSRAHAPETPRTWQLGRSKLVLQEVDDDKRLVWTRDAQRVTLPVTPGAAVTQPEGPICLSPNGRWAVVIGKQELVLVGETGIVEQIPVVPAETDQP